MEDIVIPLLLGEGEMDGEWGDDFLDLEGTMILVVQLP